jgi:HSP20 family protein
MAEQNALQKAERGTALTRPATASETWYTPRTDVLETDDEFVLCADLPGVRPEDLDLRFDRGEIALHGRCAPRRPAADPVVFEYGVGDYYRAFTLPEGVDADHITAELKDGVLTVRVPKSEAVKPRRIAVKGE